MRHCSPNFRTKAAFARTPKEFSCNRGKRVHNGLMMATVRGAAVLVTGAASGMGRLYVERAIAEQASALIAWDANGEALAELEASLADSLGATRLLCEAVDVAEPGSVAKAAQRLAKAGITVDIIINNAGIVRGNAYFWEQDVQSDVRQTVLVNLLGPMYVTRALLPQLISSERAGRIVNIASAAGTLGNPRMAVYAGSKAGLIGWSDSLRIELQQTAGKRIAVTTVAPTYLSTGMFAGARGPVLAPLMRPEYVVDRVWRAMLRGEAFLFLPWSVRVSRLLKAVLPTAAFDRLVGRWLRVYSSMDRFTGRSGR